MTTRNNEQLTIRVMRILRSAFHHPKQNYIDIASTLVNYEQDGPRIVQLTNPNNLCSIEMNQAKSSFPNFGPDELSRSVMPSMPSDMLLLNQSFGIVYLGEAFSFHLNIFNESNQIYKDVKLSVVMNFKGNETLLYPTINKELIRGIDLKPSTGIDEIFTHDIKEVGTHELTCSVSYTPMDNFVQLAPPPNTANMLQAKSDSGIPIKTRRSYCINVHNPLEVNFYYEKINNTTFLAQSQIKNATADTLFFKKAILEEVLEKTGTVEDLNQEVYDEDGKLLHHSIFGPMRFLKPNETAQFLYRLRRETDDSLKNPKAVFGKLDLAWCSTMGRITRLQTSEAKREFKMEDLILEVTDIPTEANVYESFTMKCSLYNMTGRSLNLEISIEPFDLDITKFGSEEDDRILNQMKIPGHLYVRTANFFWLGKVSKNIGEIKANDKMSLEFTLIPTKAGLQTLSGLRLIDFGCGFDRIFDNIYQVFVK